MPVQGWLRAVLQYESGRRHVHSLQCKLLELCWLNGNVHGVHGVRLGDADAGDGLHGHGGRRRVQVQTSLRAVVDGGRSAILHSLLDWPVCGGGRRDLHGLPSTLARIAARRGHQCVRVHYGLLERDRPRDYVRPG